MKYRSKLTVDAILWNGDIGEFNKAKDICGEAITTIECGSGTMLSLRGTPVYPGTYLVRNFSGFMEKIDQEIFEEMYEVI